MKEANKEISKPLCLEYDEAQKEILDALNAIMKRKTVPLFLLEIIISDVLKQISAGAKRERENATAYYEKMIKESEEARE